VPSLQLAWLNARLPGWRSVTRRPGGGDHGDQHRNARTGHFQRRVAVARDPFSISKIMVGDAPGWRQQ
jgi:hypothetical protein